MLLYFFYAVHVLICIFLILVVLLQQGSGADLSVFGGGATQTAFGARSATNLLHRLTVAGFVGFIVTTIAIGFVKMGGPGGSVMSDVPVAVEAPAGTGRAHQRYWTRACQCPPPAPCTSSAWNKSCHPVLATR